MAAQTAAVDNSIAMGQDDRTESNEPRGSARIVEMQKTIDDRDETIRLLNEALSQALDDELRRRRAA